MKKEIKEKPRYKTSFHKPVSESNEKIAKLEKRAKTQEEIILAIFKNRKRPLARFELEAILKQHGFIYPTASVVRSLANLTYGTNSINPSIRKIGIKEGNYGINVNTWTLR